MTKLLKKAFAAAAKLPDEDQDLLARWILAEVESERRWNELFAESQDVLARMADEALAEYEAGLTEDFDPDTDFDDFNID